MSALSFEGRVAVVTGAGSNPGLGRAFAMLLARRGAQVVVNDIGDPAQSDGPSAERVAAEIRGEGGTAIADRHSVAQPEGAQALIAEAIRAFGKVDILVNNAAICIPAAIDEISTADFQAHIDVNLMGAVWMCRAAWPHMREQGHGRIINITSDAMTGFAGQSAYAVSKGGLWSLTRALAAEGDALGIKVNAVSPGGYTRLVQSMLEPESPLLAMARENLPAELAAPPVAFLAHDSCPVTGECIDSVGGQLQRTFIGRTAGINDPGLSVETVAGRWQEITDTGNAEPVGIASLDSSDWKMKPYHKEESSHG